MPYRSPARFLAPLALLAAVVTIYVVAAPSLGDSSDATRSTTASTTPPARTATDTRKKRTGATARKAARKTYTVKPGDVLGSISESTGVAVAQLLEYNDLEDAQSLSVGQKLKLAP